MDLLVLDLNNIKQFSEYSNVARYYSEVSNLNDKINQAKERIKSFNDREELFKVTPPSTY